MITLFTKKTTVFKRKDKDSWLKILDALKSEGLSGVKSGHYSADTLMPGGCCSHIDPRNFGAKGYIDRDIYYVDVKREDEARAKEIIAAHGLEAVVDADPVGRLGRML